MQKCHCSGVHAGLTCACTPMVDVTDPPPPPQVACPSASGAGVFFLTVRRPHPWLPRGRIGRGPPAGRVLNSCRLRDLFGFSLPGFQPIGDGALPVVSRLNDAFQRPAVKGRIDHPRPPLLPSSRLASAPPKSRTCAMASSLGASSKRTLLPPTLRCNGRCDAHSRGARSRRGGCLAPAP